MLPRIEELERRQLLSGLGLSAAQNFPAGNSPAQIVTADINSDGFPDLIVADESDNRVGVLYGLGNGTFTTPFEYQAGKSPDAVAVADVNGDSHPDLIAASATKGLVNVMISNGDGTFAPPVKYAVGATPDALATGVLNSSYSAANVDIVSANAGSDNVSVLMGNGDGTFYSAVNYSVGSDPVAVILPILQTNSSAIDPDIVTVNQGSNTISVLLNNQNGTFKSAVSYAVGNDPTSVVAADLTGDGDMDLIVTNKADNTVSVLLGNGDGTFQPQKVYPAGKGPVAVAAADLTGSHTPALIVADQTSGMISVLLGNGNGTFQSRVPFSVASAPVGIVAADFNLDGGIDVATLSQSGDDVSVLLNTADVPTFSFANGIFLGTGTPGSDTILAHTNAADTSVILKINSVKKSEPISQVSLVSLSGGAGNDSINVKPGVPLAIVNGNGGNDTINASNSAQDFLLGGAGNDLIEGVGGGVSANGGGGNDTILAGAGNGATLNGGAGDDSVAGGPGSDLLIGGAGVNTLVGGTGLGQDTIMANPGDSVIPNNAQVEYS
ncbi:MAG: FG-GAP-like repeat-containing protein [Tepidisphaeraceae bacterium]|jgi:Ca2+-binding RTX toxin-like protein